MDLISTIEDDAEVENLSEDSDAEVEVSNRKCVSPESVNIHDFFIFIRLVPANKAETKKGHRVRKRFRICFFC